MTILHIANSYGGTSVYTNLYTAIDANAEVVQWVYVPLNSRNHDRVGNKMIDFKNEGSVIHYSTILKPYHKYLYGLRVRAIVKDAERTFDMSKVDVIHTGTLCLDGAVAYELNMKYGTPYIVTVRNTDAGYYRMSWNRTYFTKIMENAAKVIFISPKFKDVFSKNYIPANVQGILSSKSISIPNGVNETFLENISKDHKTYNGTLNIIFIAGFFKRKGLVETIKAVEILRDKGYEVTLNAIGKGLPNRPHDEEYISQVDNLSAGKDYIKLQPFMSPENLIKEMAKANCFILPSSGETFGLVYVEALSQHLPIIYGKNEGFDGFYPDGFVGYPATAGNAENIAEQIQALIKNYTNIANNVESLDLEKDFKWSNIADKYINLYKSIIK